MFGAAATTELLITVSEEVDIKMYGFSYAGAPVPWGNGDEGKFHVNPGDRKLLEWAMVGEELGHMKVTVTRDGNQVAQRPKSQIPEGETSAYDAMYIKVS